MAETEQEVLVRHRKEVKELMAKTTGMKKLATKGEKKKKKEILKEIELLEQEQKETHARELKELASGSSTEFKAIIEETADVAEDDDEAALAEQLLAEMALEESEAQEPVKVAVVVEQSRSGGGKRNRRKEKLAKKKEEEQQAYNEAANEALSLPDLRKIELENITLLCDKKNLVQHEIAADGHCLFASISDQMARRHGVQRTIQQLRTDAANYIRSDPDTFSPFLFDETTLSLRDIDSYCDELENTPLWGGDMEILALSKVYKCPISILFSGRPVLTINEEGENSELKLVYYKHSFDLGEHYSSLRDK